MTHDKNRDSKNLRQLHEDPCRLTDLRNAARRRVNGLTVHRLDRIDDYDLRFAPLQDFPDVTKICLAEDQKVISCFSDPVCPDLDLLGGFLSGNIKYFSPFVCQRFAHLQKQGGFPDSRITAYQHQRAGDNTAAQDPVQLFHPCGNPKIFLRLDTGEPRWLLKLHPSRTSGSGRRLCSGCFYYRLLHKGIPFLAGRALSHPFGGFITTVLAEKCGCLSFCHLLHSFSFMEKGWRELLSASLS